MQDIMNHLCLISNCKLFLVVLRVHTPLEDSLDQLLILMMIYMYIFGRNALIEVIFEIFERAVFDIIEAERNLSLNCMILTDKKNSKGKRLLLTL